MRSHSRNRSANRRRRARYRARRHRDARNHRLAQEARDLCSRLGVDAEMPAPWQMVTLTPGVVEGEPVEGIRVQPTARHSGWLIAAESHQEDATTDGWGHVHAVHLFESRPEIAPFLALPPGWVFDTRPGTRLCYHPQVAQESAAG